MTGLVFCFHAQVLSRRLQDLPTARVFYKDESHCYCMDVLNQNEHPYEDVKNYDAVAFAPAHRLIEEHENA